jgi:hypothetical protein
MTRIALALAGVVFAACCPKPPAPPRPLAACPHEAPSTPAELEACLHGITFDSSPEVSDSQPLTVIGTPPGAPCPGDEKKSHTCRFGPIAKIEPVKGAQNYSDDDLRQGRIIARLSIPGSEREGYAKFGLKPGQETFWWVRVDSTGRGGQSVFVTQTKDGKVEPLPPRNLVRYVYEKGERLARAIARWIWSLDDETTQGSCGGGSCR